MAALRPCPPRSTSIHLLERCAFIRRMFKVYADGNDLIEPSTYIYLEDVSRTWRAMRATMATMHFEYKKSTVAPQLSELLGVNYWRHLEFHTQLEL